MLNKSTSYNYISIYTLYISKKKINATSVETHAMFVGIFILLMRMAPIFFIITFILVHLLILLK